MYVWSTVGQLYQSAAEFKECESWERITDCTQVTCDFQSVVSAECMGGKNIARSKRMCIYENSQGK